MRKRMLKNNLNRMCGITIAIFLLLFLACALSGNKDVYAEENKSVSDFIGYYLCDMEEKGKYDNPEVMELYFNDSGNLERYSGLFVGTTGTTVCYEYTDYEIKGNTMICHYAGAFSPYYGSRSDIEAGSHEYVLTDDGNITSENHVWYRYLTEEEKQPQPGMLGDVQKTDFTGEKYSEECNFLGITGLSRKTVEEITFLDTLKEKPDQAWDVSRDKDGSVYVWLGTEKDNHHLYVAADGMVRANPESGSLFRLCTNVRKINFNESFDTSAVQDMEYMFADCKNLEEISGLENIDTSSVTNMEAMFSGCENLKELNLKEMDVSCVAKFNKMFYNCSSLSNIDIDHFQLGGDQEYEDIFKGTVREGDAPGLSLERNRKVVTSYILDTENVSVGDTYLRAKIVNTYDDELKQLCMLTGTLTDTLYAIEEINGDQIPDLIIKKCLQDSSNSYSAYTYNQEQGRIEGISDFNIDAENDKNYDFRYAYPETVWQGYVDMEKEEDNIHNEDKMDSEERTDSDNENNTDNDDDVDDDDNADDDIDIEDDESSKEYYDLTVYAEKDEYGYASLLLYVNDQQAYVQEMQNYTSEVDISGYMMSDHSIWLSMRAYSEMSDDYCGILRYKDGECKEVFNLDQGVNELQLVTNSGHNYFEVDFSSGTGEILLQYHLYTISYGDDFSFSLKYNYQDGELLQKDYLTDLNGMSNEFYTLAKDKKIYDGIASRKVKYTASAGTTLTPDKIWIYNGIIWLQVKDKDGQAGWTPLGAENVYLENSYTYGSSVEEKIKKNEDNDVYFKDSSVPGASVLYQMGEKSFRDGKYENAIIYYQFIGILNLNYVNAREGIKKAESKLNDALFADIKSKYDNQEYEQAYEELIMQKQYLEDDEKYQEYLKLCQKELNTGEDNEQSNKTETKSKKQKDSPQKQAKKELIKLLQMNNFASQHLLAYSMLDLDQDGTDEFISRNYTSESTEGGAYVYNVYQYDEISEKYKHLSSATFYSFVNENCIYFWKEQGYLVIDCSMGAYDFILYSFQDGNLHEEYDTSADMSYLPKVEFKEVKLSKTKEGKSYKKFLERGLFEKETDGLDSVMYGIYDLDGDGVCELVMKGKDDDQKYQYLLSTYKNGKRQTLGFFGNWQNGGDGELFTMGEKGKIVVNTRLSDRQTYKIYDITDGIKFQYSVSKQSLDELNDQGTYDRVYEYSAADDQENEIESSITTDEEWNSFENSLTEIPFYQIPWSENEMQQNYEEAKKQKEEAAKKEKNKRKQTPYEKIINQKEQEYGEYTLEDMGNYQYASGVCYLELRDLNHDGTDELLLVYNNNEKDEYGSLKIDSYQYEMWTCVSGKAVLMETDHLYYSNGGWPSVCWTEYNGNTYLVTNYDNVDSCWFHGFKSDGSFGVAETFLFEYTDNGFKTSVNGKEVSQEEWKTQYSEYMENAIYINLFYENSDIVYPMVQKVKKELADSEKNDLTKNSGIQDVGKIVQEVKGISEIGDTTAQIFRKDEGTFSQDFAIDAGILAAVSMDFDGDGDEEIFCVSYEMSAQSDTGKAIYFSILKNDGNSWKIQSEQEINYCNFQGIYVDESCLNTKMYNHEVSVFLRKCDGEFEFYYEGYYTGIMADGEGWFFRGFRYANGVLNPIRETDELFYEGSEGFWDTFDSNLEEYCTLGFAKTTIGFDSLTADQNSDLYEVLRMKKQGVNNNQLFYTIDDESDTLSGEIKENGGMPGTVSESSLSEPGNEYLLPDVDARYLSENEIAAFNTEQLQLAINEIFARHGKYFQTEEIAAYFQSKSWYHPDVSKTDDQITSEFNDYEKANEKMLESVRDELGGTTAQRSEDTSFYGIWCYGSKEPEEANSYAETLKASGFDAGVFITTNWSNLNTERFFVVTAGIYATEDEANAALASVQGICPDAYVKYSGDFLG